MGIFIIFVIVLIGIDQLAKYLSSTYLIDKTLDSFVLNLTYHENAFMIGQISFNWLMILVSIIMLIIFIMFFLNQYAKKVRTRMNLVIFTLILAGGISNLIDRIAKGFVVDYIELKYILQGIVFNIADICIVIGVILLIGMYLITITDDKVVTMAEGENGVQNKSTKQWFKDLFKNR